MMRTLTIATIGMWATLSACVEFVADDATDLHAVASLTDDVWADVDVAVALPAEGEIHGPSQVDVEVQAKESTRIRRYMACQETCRQLLLEVTGHFKYSSDGHLVEGQYRLAPGWVVFRSIDGDDFRLAAKPDYTWIDGMTLAP